MAERSLTLYQLAGAFAALNALADDELDEQAVTDTLEGLRGHLEHKATNVARFCRNLEALAAQIRAEEERMHARRLFLERRAQRIKDYLRLNLEAIGLREIQAPEFRIAIKHNPPSVVIDDQTRIPAQFFVIQPPPPPVPDKRAIGDALKAGSDVPGAHLDTGKTRLEIK